MQNKYTSLKLSKLIKEAGFEGDIEKIEKVWLHTISDFNKLMDSYCDRKLFGMTFGDVDGEWFAYDLIWDICIKYAIEFFGEEEIKITKHRKHIYKDIDSVGLDDNIRCVYCNLDESWEGYDCKTQKIIKKGWEYHTKQILYLLQQGKQDEAEQYFIDNSILFK